MSERTVDLGDPEEGFAVFKLGECTVRLDVFEVNNKVADYHSKNRAKGDLEYNAGLIDLVSACGLPRCSAAVALKFVRAVQAEVRRLGESIASGPGSPASTQALTRDPSATAN